MVRKTPDKDLGVCGVFLRRVHHLAGFGFVLFIFLCRFEQSLELKESGSSGGTRPEELVERLCGVRTASPPGDVGPQEEEEGGEGVVVVGLGGTC